MTEKPENVREEIEALYARRGNGCHASLDLMRDLALRLAERVERLEAALREADDAGVEMEHIQNFGETFQMTVDRLTEERDEARRELAKWEQENR